MPKIAAGETSAGLPPSPGAPQQRHQFPGVARLEAFRDGVFAFAATLLALGIRIPRPDDGDASIGLAAAFRSDQTPPFGQMVSRLFSQSGGQQQAGLLNTLLAACRRRGLSEPHFC